MLKRQAYTLMEVLVVMAIILLLAGMTFGITRVVSRKNYEAKTKARLQLIISALEAYRSDYGYYPIQNPSVNYASTSTSDDEKVRLKTSMILSLRKPGSGKRYLDWFNVVYESGIDTSKLTSNQQTYCMDGSDEDDASGIPRCFYYICPGKVNPKKYDLWAKGLDKEHGRKGQGNDLEDALTRENNDDITSWK